MLPSNLSKVCYSLEANQEFVDAFGAEAVDTLVSIKRYEWEKYTTAVSDWEKQVEAVTDWELEFYLPYL